METEKEKPLPEKCPSFISRDEGKTEDNHEPYQGQRQTLNQETDINPPKEVEINDETDHKKEDPTVETIIEDSPPPLDLGIVSEQIDQFISDLSSSKLDEFEPPEIPQFVEQFAFLIEAKIANYDSSELPVKWSQMNEDDSSSFLEDLDRISHLSTSIYKFSSESKYASSISRIGDILERAMSYLEEEFRSILEDYSIPDLDNNTKTTKQTSSTSNQDADGNITPSVSTAENKFPGYSGQSVTNLNRLAKKLISGGHDTECSQIYFIARRNAVEGSLHKLGFEKFSIDEVQKMHWESLEREIVAWIKTVKECTNAILSCERKLAEVVFSDCGSICESLFANLSGGVMIELLNFAEAVAMTKSSAEKVFKFLDIYETLRDLIPAMDSLFPVDCANELKFEASLTRRRLGDAMICIFCELENSIKSDTGKTTVPGGAVHPLTRYTMNYLKYACEYKDTLEQVFIEHKIELAGSDYDCNDASQDHDDHHNKETTEKQSPFELQMQKVMDLLDTNLESKSKLYKDPSLSLIFMMNNGRYILQKIKGSAEMMGNPWCRKKSSDLRQYHKGYQRETWGKLVHCLNHEGLMVNGKVVKPVLKERFKSFNAMFDEIQKAQSMWVVSDEQLQSELRVSISSVVIPAYRSFMGRFSQTFTPGRQSERYIKYQPEDIETYIDELFDGNANAMGKRRP